MVWDRSSGTANLTRDYKFKELYLSTLGQTDINIIEEAGYSPEATKFQFDFLNDDLSKLPDGLRWSLDSGKKFVFLNNPPYGTANDFGAKGTEKSGIASNTMINKQMKENNIGESSQQLYAQFMYRIMDVVKKYKIKNSVMGTFSNVLFMCGESFEGFRKNINMGYVDGMIFKASHFSDVSDSWGIAFTVFKSLNFVNSKNFIVKIKDYSDEGRIVTVIEKELYNLDGIESASKWVREPNKGIKTLDYPQMTNATCIKPDGRGRICCDSLGYFLSNANNTYDNLTSVALFSSCPAKANGLSITKNNFERCIVLYSARKLIEPNWMNQKDEYMVPNTNHPDYQQFVNDSIIYSLFNSASNQSSLRQIEYKNKKWDIVNNFFFMSIKEIQDLAIEYNFNDLYNDTISHPGDRYVYNQLNNIILSPDAKEVLDMARNLIIDSFQSRQAASNIKPEMHLQAWDAGWYQIKNGILKEQFKDKYKEFTDLYKSFSDRLILLVYELGFLKK